MLLHSSKGLEVLHVCMQCRRVHVWACAHVGCIYMGFSWQWSFLIYSHIPPKSYSTCVFLKFNEKSIPAPAGGVGWRQQEMWPGWWQSSARGRLGLTRIPCGMWGLGSQLVCCGEERAWVCMCMCMSHLSALQQQPGQQSPARGPGWSSTALWNTHCTTNSGLETLSKKNACCLFLLHSEKQDSKHMLCK